MEQDLIALLVVTLVAQISLRFYPNWRWLLGTDTFFHLKVAEQIRVERKLPATITGFFFHGPYAYPPLLHLLLFLVRGRTARLLPVFCDLLHLGLVFVMAYQLSSHYVLIALLSCVVYLSIPANYNDCLSISPRPIGSLLFTASILSLLSLGDTWAAVVFAGLYALLLLSHKLSTQVSWVVLGLLALCIPDLRWRIAIGVLLAFSLVTIFTRGFYLDVLREHLGYLRFHIEFGGLNRRKSFTDPLVLVRSNPFILLLPLAYVQEISVGMNNLVFLLWGVAALGLAALWRFGDGYRHLSLASSAISLLTAFLSNSLPAVLTTGLFIAYGLSKQIRYLRRLTPPFMISQQLQESLAATRDQHGKCVLCLPLSYSYACAYFTGKLIVAGDASIKGLIEGFNLSKEIETPDGLADVVDKTGVELILLESKTQLEHSELLRRRGFEQAFSNSCCTVLRRRATEASKIA
jgi:hypothetical protein